jgi:hypothetical protein
MFRTHYDNLQVKPGASNEVIRSAYKALSQKYHPDRNPGKVEECTRIMAIINKAYQVLSDPALRTEHNAWIKQQNAEHDTTEARAGADRPWQDQPQPDGPSSMRSSRAGKPPSNSGGFSQTWKDLSHGQARANKAAAQQSASQQHSAKENASATAKTKKPMTLLDLLVYCVLGGAVVTFLSPQFRYSDLFRKEWYQLIFDPRYLGLLASYTAELMGAALCVWIPLQLLRPTRRSAAPIALAVTCFIGFSLVKANAEKVKDAAQNAVAAPLKSSSLAKPGQDESARKYNETVRELQAQHSELNSDSAAEVIDPEKYVLKSGYHSVEVGDDGKTPRYSFTNAPGHPVSRCSKVRLPNSLRIQRFSDFATSCGAAPRPR